MVKIWSRNGHGIDALIVQNPANVGIGRRTLLPRSLHHLAAARDNRLIDVAQRRDFHVGHLQVGGNVRFAPTVEPDDRDPDGVVLTRTHPRLEGRGQRHRTHQKMPAIDLSHDFSFACDRGGPNGFESTDLRYCSTTPAVCPV
jgi:hypothetical protein